MNACRRNGKFENGAIVSMPDSALEAVAQGVEVELGLQVVHAGFEDRLAVEGDPEPDGARPRQVRQRHVGKVVRRLFGSRSRSAKMTMPVTGCSRTCAPQPACSPA